MNRLVLQRRSVKHSDSIYMMRLNCILTVWCYCMIVMRLCFNTTCYSLMKQKYACNIKLIMTVFQLLLNMTDNMYTKVTDCLNIVKCKFVMRQLYILMMNATICFLGMIVRDMILINISELIVSSNWFFCFHKYILSMNSSC